jgi:hypothetical protein
MNYQLQIHCSFKPGNKIRDERMTLCSFPGKALEIFPVFLGDSDTSVWGPLL